MVVIAILAAITITAYRGITSQSQDSSVKSDLATGAKQLHLAQVETGSFPSDSAKPDYLGDNLTYTGGGNEFCLAATSGTSTFHVTQVGSVEKGVCPFTPGGHIQIANNSNCPAARTLATDARDTHTYWIKKMPDGNCWMLTNLAYAGGGTNAYGDVKTIELTGGLTYTDPRYYTHSAASPTTYPSEPSTDTVGGGFGPGRQYGYHYNWCAAMGNQQGTAACLNAITPEANMGVSVCPAGWRLPTSKAATGEFQLLASSIAATNNSVGSTNLRVSWLAQQSGSWYNTFYSQGDLGYYWSATQSSATNAHYFVFSGSGVYSLDGGNKYYGASVRCVASI